MEISLNTLERLCRIFGYLGALEKRGINFISSPQLAKAVGATEYTIRKDISLLGATGHTRRGYAIKLLKEELGRRLHLNEKRKACIVGLGRLGTALLDYKRFQEDGFEIVAGFDRSINKIERMQTHIEVFTTSQLVEVIKQKSIELGIITVPAEAAQEVADKLIRAGVRGILNFSPVKIKVPNQIIYLDMDFTNALRFIAARFSRQKGGLHGKSV